MELLRKEVTGAQDELAEVCAAERVVARIMTDTRDAPHQDSTSRDAMPIGMITVPVRGAGALPEDYVSLRELIATAPKPLTCRDLCAQLGWELLPTNTEGVRSKLRRMVERGWLAEERPGSSPRPGRAYHPGDSGAVIAGTQPPSPLPVGGPS